MLTAGFEPTTTKVPCLWCLISLGIKNYNALEKRTSKSGTPYTNGEGKNLPCQLTQTNNKFIVRLDTECDYVETGNTTEPYSIHAMLSLERLWYEPTVQEVGEEGNYSNIHSHHQNDSASRWAAM